MGGLKHRRALLLAASLAVSCGAAHSQDGAACHDAVDRLLRGARDAESKASEVNQEPYERSAMDDVYSALDDVEQRLRQAKGECSYVAPQVRMCLSLRSLAQSQGMAKARQLCTAATPHLPNFCDQCLGKP